MRHAATGALIVFFTHVRLGIPAFAAIFVPCRRVGPHILGITHIPGILAKRPAPHALEVAALIARPIGRANTLGDVRMGYRLVNFSVWSEACAAPTEATPIGANTDHRQCCA